MRIEEINDPKEFLALKDTWDKLLQRCDRTIFSTWEWLTTWWNYFGKDKKLILLLAEEKGEIIGIAPFMYSVYTLFGSHRGVIEFIGTPDSDYNNFIIAEKKEECTRLFINYLYGLKEKWESIDLTDIPQGSISLQFLAKMLKSLRPIRKCPYALLPKPPDAFLDTLKSKERKELRRNLRRLEERFTVEFADYSGKQSYSEGMKTFFELHQKRWESRGFPGVFTGKELRNFHLDVAESFSRKNWLGLFILRLSEEPAAALYGFRYGSKYCAYLSGFDPKYIKHGVGSLVFSYAIAECTREGLVEFDFMRGGEKYKDQWNTKVRWNREAILIKRGLFRNAEHVLYNEYWRQGRRFQYVVKNAPRTLAEALNKKRARGKKLTKEP